MIDIPTLIACGVNPTQARIFAEPLAAACAAWDVSTPIRQAMFVAQAMWESDKFTDLEENLYYTTAQRVRAVFGARAGKDFAAIKPLLCNPQALANRVYANRYGNGDEASGDGWLFRGRGIGGLTFRGNYRDAAHACSRPYESIPDFVSTPRDACTTFAWYWNAHHCNALADSGDVDGVTRKINPGMAGAKGRGAYFATARVAFKV